MIDGETMKVRVYVDGFNLYYGAGVAAREYANVTGAAVSWRWLDVERLCESLIVRAWPTAAIDHISYFTAHVKPRWPGDLAHERQDVYLRGLAKLGVEVVPGRFLRTTEFRPLAYDPDTERAVRSRDTIMVHVWDVEEKGSDVNLASRLLVDHFTLGADYDGAVVVSNDSDLEMPVATLRAAGRPVGILNPHRSPTPSLTPRGLAAPHFGLTINATDVIAAQLADPIVDRTGAVIRTKKGATYSRPAEWA